MLFRSFVFTNDVRCSWGGKDGILSNDEFGNTVGRTDLENGLNSFGREETSITTDDESNTLGLDRIKDRLDEVLGVVLKVVFEYQIS